MKPMILTSVMIIPALLVTSVNAASLTSVTHAQKILA
jgi:hypothetical protein